MAAKLRTAQQHDGDRRAGMEVDLLSSTATRSTRLAVDGGPPVRTRPWPAWPRVTRDTEAFVLDALHSGRWALSGAFTGRAPYERRFAEAFAAYHGVPFCTPTCNGSAALTIAFEALGIGAGDEVLVPGLTWVACASAVAAVGAVPVLVDVERETLCISASAAEAAITKRTAAALVVHLFCSAAQIDEFQALCRRHSLALIEDCSQAHGATWRGQRIGTMGELATYSFQQTKLLTCGEGGAVITSDAALHDRTQQLRADGRRYLARPHVGRIELEEVGDLQGHNYCLGELQAALLLAGLARLDEENEIRRRNVTELDHLLASFEGLSRIGQPEALDGATYYGLCLRADEDAFGGRLAEWIANALTAELGIEVDPVDRPLNANPLYDPRKSARHTPRDRELLDPTRFHLPAAESARRTCFTIPHQALLGEGDMQDIERALKKVRDAA
jgi:dTDP-4-amino-4,6-dideoxygalactose transaminase